MPDGFWQTLGIISVTAIVTFLLRAFPFLLFRGKGQLPGYMNYLGYVLPMAVMVILVIFCVKDVVWTTAPFGASTLLSIAVVVGMQKWRKNTFLSIIVGTACYMLLTRLAGL